MMTVITDIAAKINERTHKIIFTIVGVSKITILLSLYSTVSTVCRYSIRDEEEKGNKDILVNGQ